MSVAKRLRRAAVASALACAAIAVSAAGAASANVVPTINLETAHIKSGTLDLPYAVVASPNGKTVYLADNAGVLVFDASNPSATPKTITYSGGISDPVGISLSPNGKTLYIANHGDVLAADVGGTGATNDTVVGELADPSALVSNATSVAVSPNGKTLYIGNLGSSPMKSSLLVASLSGPTTGTIKASHTDSHLGDPVDLTVSPNGKLVYIGTAIGLATAVSVSGTTVEAFHVLPELLDGGSIAISPDGRTLYDATGFSDLLENNELGGSEINTFALSASGLTATLERSTYLSHQAIAFGLSMAATGTKGYVSLDGLKKVGSSYDPVPAYATFAIPAAASKVSVTGQAKVGKSLAASVKGAGGLSASYKWLANGKAIAGATKKTLKLTAKLKGKKVSVSVTAGATGYHEVSLKSKATAKVA